MSGISGILSSAFQDEHPTMVQTMIQAMAHRGPDAQRTHTVSKQPEVIFGHALLATIDRSSQAIQPMIDGHTENAIVMDGEIYNYKVLRKELQALGHAFSTQSDTEVLLHAYAQWGDDCLQRLRGIFAFAIWDTAKQRLLLARDALGVKPLYVFQKNGELRFASEFRALLATGIDRKIDMNGLLSYLAFGSLQEPFTLAQGIFSLRPAHKLVWQNGKTEITPHWQPDLSPAEGKPDDLLRDLEDELKAAVKMQLAADLPVGALLSGGIDSSAIVALLRQVRPDITLNTYTLVPDADSGESDFARLVATRNKTCHKALILDTKTIRKHINEALDSYDLPSYDGLNTWYAAKLTKATGLGIAFSGVGGDELFAGYNQFGTATRMEKSAAWLKMLPHKLGIALAGHVDSEKLRKTFQTFGYREQPYYLSRQMFSPLTVAQLLERPLDELDDGWRTTAFPYLTDTPFPHDRINRFSLLDLTTYLVSTLLRDTDQMGMANGLPFRAPLLDRHVVEKALRLPGALKISADCAKPILVHAAASGLPDECVHRPKQGFVLPFDAFFANNFKKPIRDFLNATDSPIFTSQALRTVAHLHERKQMVWNRLWTLFILDRFCRKHSLTL